MIFRLSQKLVKKMKEAPSQSLPMDANPFADWSCHLFTADRTQFIILTNTPSLYSAVMYGAGNTNGQQFIRRALDCIREFMVGDGFEFVCELIFAPTTTESILFSKALNRSVTGSMNDLIYHAKSYLVERGLSPFDTAVQLNDIPMSALRYQRPRNVFKALNVGQPVSEKGSD
jgi:hypothetical protein